MVLNSLIVFDPSWRLKNEMRKTNWNNFDQIQCHSDQQTVAHSKTKSKIDPLLTFHLIRKRNKKKTGFGWGSKKIWNKVDIDFEFFWRFFPFQLKYFTVKTIDGQSFILKFVFFGEKIKSWSFAKTVEDLEHYDKKWKT